MAKKKVAAAPVADDLDIFGVEAAPAAAPKKAKGTVFELPKELDAEGKLTGESAILHQAVTDVITADDEAKAAKNKADMAKGTLNRWVTPTYAQQMAKLATLPPTPVTLVNHLGHSLTFVVQDRSKAAVIADDQLEALRDVIPTIDTLVEVRKEYAFNSDTLAEVAAGPEANPGEPVTVQAVVFKIVSDAIRTNNLLSVEQKKALIAVSSKRYLKPGVITRMAELCGANAARIERFMKNVGSALVCYLKA